MLLRDPRHERRAALLRPRAAARARAAGRAGRARARRRPLPGAELLARRPRRRGARGGRRGGPRPGRARARTASRCASATAGPRSSRRGSRTSTASARRSCARGQPCSFHARVRVNEAPRGSAGRRQLPELRRRARAGAPTTSWPSRSGRLRARRGVHVRAALRRTSWPRTATGSRPRWPRATAAWSGTTAATRFASVMVTAHAADRRAGRPARSRSTSSARSRRRAGARGGRMSDVDACADRGARGADQGPDRARQRPAPPAAADVGAGGHRLPAALLRLGAGLPVVSSCSR